MAGTYVDNYSKRYATNKWVWWTERDAIGIAKYDPVAEKFYSPDADQPVSYTHLTLPTIYSV